MRVGRPGRAGPADQDLLLRVYELVRDDVGLADGVRVLRTWPAEARRRALLAGETRPRALVDLTRRRRGVPAGRPSGWPHDRARELLLASLEPGDPPVEPRGPQHRAQDAELARLVRLPVAEAFEELRRRSPALAALAASRSGPPGGALPSGPVTRRETVGAVAAYRKEAGALQAQVRAVVGPDSSASDPVLRSERALTVALAYLLAGPDGLVYRR